MPRAPSLEKTIDNLIILLFNDPRLTDEDLKLIIPEIKSIVRLIHEAFQRN